VIVVGTGFTGLSKETARLDKKTFADLLREQGASPEAVRLLSLGFNDTRGTGAEGVSALFVVKQMQRIGGRDSAFAQGTGRLLLSAFATGEAGRRLSDLPDDDAVRFVGDQMTTFYPDLARLLRERDRRGVARADLEPRRIRLVPNRPSQVTRYHDSRTAGP
jgi:hypothetical protein